MKSRISLAVIFVGIAMFFLGGLFFRAFYKEEGIVAPVAYPKHQTNELDHLMQVTEHPSDIH